MLANHSVLDMFRRLVLKLSLVVTSIWCDYVYPASRLSRTHVTSFFEAQLFNYSH